MSSSLASIGSWRLTGYFEDLDTVKEFGLRNMAEAANIMLELHASVSDAEAHAIALAWSQTFSETVLADDRADRAIVGELEFQLKASKGGIRAAGTSRFGVRGITEDHRYEMLCALQAKAERE